MAVHCALIMYKTEVMGHRWFTVLFRIQMVVCATGWSRNCICLLSPIQLRLIGFERLNNERFCACVPKLSGACLPGITPCSITQHELCRENESIAFDISGVWRARSKFNECDGNQTKGAKRQEATGRKGDRHDGSWRRTVVCGTRPVPEETAKSCQCGYREKTSG